MRSASLRRAEKADMTPPPLATYYAGRTDVGRHRDHNEDAYGLPNPPGVSLAQLAGQGTLLVVADGMGGRAAGEEASALAVRTLFAHFYADSQPDRRAAMSAALAAANTAVKSAGEDDLSKAGMGSTVAALVIAGDKYLVAHAGDSRIYRLRAGKLEPLTIDHTWVAESVAAKVITEAEAANHPYRHSLTRALGLETTLNPTVSDWLPLAAGDRFLLCSDGLTNELTEAEIARLLGEGSPDQAATRLVERARRAGGRDNITAVAAAIGNGGAAIAPAPKTAGGNGRRNWPLLLAGGVVGLVVFALVISGLGNPAPPQKQTATPEVQAMIQTAIPSLTPTTRPPTSTIALTPTQTYTPTFTPTPPPTSTPTATPMSWNQLAEVGFRLDQNARQALADEVETLCQDYRPGDEICKPAISALSILITGTLKLDSGLLDPAWDAQTSFARREWPVENQTGLKKAIKGVRQAIVLGTFPRWKPLLVMTASEAVPPYKCLFMYQVASSDCYDLERAGRLGWRVLASPIPNSSALKVLLEAGEWRHVPPATSANSPNSYIEFVPRPGLSFQLDRETLTYQPVPPH